MEATATIDPRTRIGAVRLAVRDLDAVRDFYERSIGLRRLDDADGVARLGTGDGSALVELQPTADAPARPPGTTGLFHLAILVPTRRDLAAALQRVGDSGWRFTGASDHLVSEALYLNDPEGNGIEIYRDRPASSWDYDGGQVRMATIPLDVQGVIGELNGAEPGAAMPDPTRIGHVHLNVADLASTEAFYSDGLGHDVTVRDYPGALFMSAGGYHHHVGANTWAGEGAPPPPPGALGLRSFEVVVPSSEELEAAAGRLREAGHEVSAEAGAVDATDSSGNRVRLVTG